MKTTPITPELVELATRLRIAFAMVARAQRQDVPGKLTAVQLSALYKVEVLGPIRLGELATREQVAGPTMCRVVDSLESGGFVRRETDPASARCSLISITPTGRSEIDAVRRDRTDFMTCRLANLTEEQLQTLAAALPAIEALVESVVPGERAIADREAERTRQARRDPPR